MMNWIIAYNIAHRSRLQKVHRYLSDIATPIQNSTFLYTGSQAQLMSHLKELERIIHPSKDNLCAYPLLSKRHSLGKPTFPQGIVLIDFPEQNTCIH